MGQWRLFFLKSCLNLKLLSLLAPGTRGGVTGPFASHHSVNSLIRSFIHSFIPTLQGTVRAGGQPGGGVGGAGARNRTLLSGRGAGILHRPLGPRAWAPGGSWRRRRAASGWVWDPERPAPPGLWGRPAVLPVGSRGQCSVADGGSSRDQAGFALLTALDQSWRGEVLSTRVP